MTEEAQAPSAYAARTQYENPKPSYAAPQPVQLPPQHNYFYAPPPSSYRYPSPAPQKVNTRFSFS